MRYRLISREWGKKLYLKESVDVDICLNYLEWAALVLAVEGVRYLAAGMSIRSSTTLYRRLSCIFVRLVSKVSHSGGQAWRSRCWCFHICL